MVSLLPTDLVPTHTLLNSSSKSTEFLPCEQTSAKASLRFSSPESVDGDTSMHQAFTGRISKEGHWHSHAALFHKHLLDRTFFFCQRVTNPTGDWPLRRTGLAFLCEGISSSSPTAHRCSHKYPHHTLTGGSAKGMILHLQKDFSLWKWG